MQYFAIGEEVIHAPTGTVHTVLQAILVTPENKKQLLGTTNPYYGYWYQLTEMETIDPGITARVQNTLSLLRLLGGGSKANVGFPLVPQPVLRKKPPSSDMKFKELIKFLNKPIKITAP